LVDFIELLTRAVEVIFEVLENLIDSVLAVCKQRIFIPFVTDFYENVVVEGKSQFSVLSLLALITAIPFTVTCKLASGKSGPVFTPADVAAVQDPNWELWTDLRAQIQDEFGGSSGEMATKPDRANTELASAGSVSVESVNSESVSAGSVSAGSVLKSYVTDCICGFGYSASTLMWGISCYEEDSVYPVPAGTAIGKVKLCNQALANLFGLPVISMPPGVDKSATGRYIVWGIWTGGVGALVSNTVAIMTSCWQSPYCDALVTGLYGAAQVGLYTWLVTIVAEHNETATAIFDGILAFGESFEWVPQLFKPVGRLFPEFMGDAAAGMLAARVEFCAYLVVTAATAVSAAAATYKLIASLGND